MSPTPRGPIVVNGVVIAGSNCQEAAHGCYVTGNDAQTGKELWRNNLIPNKGEPGDETWGGMPFEQRWMTGVWGPITYDPDLNLAFYGSSGVGPSSDTQRGVKGIATLAGTNTRFAVDPKTGKIVWKHQVLPQDNADQECTFEMMPITTPVHPDPKAKGMMAMGRNAASASRKTLTGVPCKTSIMWSFDAAKGDFLWAKSTVVPEPGQRHRRQGPGHRRTPTCSCTDLHKTYHQCPTHAGGRDWPFSAYSPQTNVMYVRAAESLRQLSACGLDNIPSQPSDQYNTIGPQVSVARRHQYRAAGRHLGGDRQTLWSWETPASNYSPVLATAGGILFNGSMDRYFRAFDQTRRQGAVADAAGLAGVRRAVTFSIGGRQYIAVAAGGGFNNGPIQIRPDLDQPSGGNMVYVFALPQ